jgi:hypothetical protein
MVTVDEPHATTMIRDSSKEDFLKGFGLALVEEKIPKYTQTRGMFGRGVHLAAKYRMQCLKNFDLNLTKIRKVESAPEILFGNLWGSKNIVDKRIVDNIIMAIKKLPFDDDCTWIKSTAQIKVDYGLDENLHKNQLLSPDEQMFIKEDFKSEFHIAYEILDLKCESGKLPAFSEQVQKLVRAFKPYKEFVTDIINSRLRAIYSKKENKARKKRQQPIKVLVESMKYTKEYLDAFNPCRAARLPSFQVPFVPQSPEEFNKVAKALSNWCNSINEPGLKTRALLVESWYLANFQA